MTDYNIDKLAEILHTLGCKKDHAQDMVEVLDRKPHMCYWYLEQSLSFEYQTDRQEWRNHAKELCEKYKLPSQEFLRFLFQYLEIRQKMDNLRKKYSVKAVEDLAPLLLFDSESWQELRRRCQSSRDA